MKTEIRKITPELAEKLLENNIINRKIDSGHVLSIVQHMLNGDWKDSGDAIRISKTGRLLDGQHRLRALIKANKNFDFNIVSDLEDEVFDVIDTGKVRTARDMFVISSIHNGTNIAAIIRAIINWENSGVTTDGGERSGNKVKAPFLILERYNTSPNHYQDLHKIIVNWYKNNRSLGISEYGLLHHILSMINPIHADEFLTSLSTGSNLDLDSPILLLRNKLSEYKSNRLRPTFKLKMNLIFTAWNHWRKGGTLKFLRLPSDANVFPI